MNHKTLLMLSDISYMLQCQSAIARDFNNCKGFKCNSNITIKTRALKMLKFYVK